jgi:starch synthase
MNILFIASEIYPFFQTNDLANIVYGLSKELSLHDNDVRVVIPRYRTANKEIIGESIFDNSTGGLGIQMGTYSRTGGLIKVEKKPGKNPVLYFVNQDFYFGRDDLYGYYDDHERFIFFTRFALNMLSEEEFKSKEANWFPDIIQGFDWVSGLVPGWLPEYRLRDARFEKVRFLLYIHNIRRLGKFGNRARSLAKIEKDGIYTAIGENADQVNFLGRGILFADQVVTINPDFNNNNPLPQNASSLQAILQQRLKDSTLSGIPTGIDTINCDPKIDEKIAQNYSYNQIEQRIQNKLALQAELGFKQDKNIPLLGLVSRLVPENGLELLSIIEKSRSQLGEFQLAILAEPGDTDYKSTIQNWEKVQDPRKPWVKNRFTVNDRLAHLIYAGCDIYLAPVRESYCSLTQQMAIHYGAVPVAHATGALLKTVYGYKSGLELYALNNQRFGIGFTFSNFTEEDFLSSLQEALHIYREHPVIWNEIQLFNLHENMDWNEPATQFLLLYNQMIARPSQPYYSGTSAEISKDARLLQALLEISNLPGQGKRSSSDILKPAARLLRWVLSCNAVYVRGLEKRLQLSAGDVDDQQITILEKSLDLTSPNSYPDDESVTKLLNQSTNNIWRRQGDVDQEGICQPLIGLETSDVANRVGWKEGLSVPIVAHGRLLGWIDTLFTDTNMDRSWVISSLTSLANSFGLRLDTIRATMITDLVSEIGADLISAQSVDEIRTKACNWVNQLIPDSQAKISNVIDQRNSAADNPEYMKLVDRVLQTRQIVYIADWNEAPRDKDNHRLYRSIMVIPIMNSSMVVNESINCLLTVTSRKQAAFTNDDEHLLLNRLSPQIYHAVQKALRIEESNTNRVFQLKKLVDSLIAGVDFDRLLQKVVDTIADVLQVRAVVLYLLDGESKLLKIRAAYGYQRKFLEENITYQIGEGLTGWIAREGKVVKADNLEQLHQHPGWRGKNNILYNVPEPNAFLGIPLVIKDSDGNQKVTGILKVEDRKESSEDKVFTDEDVHLAEMMANVIAIVVYNAQQSEKQLRDFSDNLRNLSNVLAGGRDLPTLMDNIVKRLFDVLHVDAASLYLANEDGTELSIQAAAGYQETLIEQKVKYKFGQGVTGTIAAEKKAVVTNSQNELRQIGRSPNGAFDHLHKDHLLPQSFYGLPMIVKDLEGTEKAIGVLKVESTKERFFSGQDVLLIEMMANVIATVVYNAQQSEKHLRDFSDNLRKLSDVLAGSRDLPTLMNNIIKRLFDVLHVDAASLYLANAEGNELAIEAAAGYQETLIIEKAKYKFGKGVTGTIAAQKKAVVTNSQDELRQIGRSPNGAFDHLHKDHLLPQSFYGLPMIVKDMKGTEKVVGVLKVESTKERFFSIEDVLLIEMMANVIATVVYNAQQSEEHLRDFSNNLRVLSDVLAGGRDFPTLMDNIVKKLFDVLHVDAASLYLANEEGTELSIEAAAGYQETLVEQKVKYKFGQGVTGTIAAQKKAVVTNSQDELRRIGGSPKGAFDHLHKNHLVPQSFYGLPMIIKGGGGNEKVVGVLKVESTKERFFSSEDVLLIEMIANVIVTVVYNAQQNEQRIGNILKGLGSLSTPSNDVSDLLHELVTSQDASILHQVGVSIATVLENNQKNIEEEAKLLFEAHASSEIFGWIASSSLNETICWKFSLYQNILTHLVKINSWQNVENATLPWQNLKQNVLNPDKFSNATRFLAEAIAKALGTKTIEYGRDHSTTWYGVSMDTHQIFGNIIESLPLIFQTQRQQSSENLDWLRVFVQKGLGPSYSVICCILWDSNISQDEIKNIRDHLHNHLIDVAFLQISEVLQLLEKPDPANFFNELIMHQVTITPPFIIYGPVPDALFFGRVKEINEISQLLKANRSCALIGGRRIGKTSVLQRLHRVTLPQLGYQSIYIDCYGSPTYEAFIRTPIRDWQPQAQPNYPSTIKDLLAAPPTNKQVVLLLDEVDGLLSSDLNTNWPLFNRLRALSSAGMMQFVLGGEQVLRQEFKNTNSPLFNSANKIILGPLQYAEIEKLIEVPMKARKIELVQRNDIVKKIAEVSGGHPNIIQRLCTLLIINMNEKNKHSITLEDIEIAINEPKFRREDFLETYWEKATPLEKIITILLAETPSENRATTIRKGITDRCKLNVQKNEIDDALQRLVELRSILEETVDGYKFRVKSFPVMVGDEITRNDMLESLVESYRKVNS